MSLTLKLGSLVIRTLSKPLANYLKRSAREHESFRKVAVTFAQHLHRFDMRLRLGLLQDPAVIDRQIAREVAEVEKRRAQAAIPTVKTELESKADDAARAKEHDSLTRKVKADLTPRIRPLSESKAIDSGANFVAEAFLFMVAGGLILFENRRNKKKQEKAHDARDEEIEDIRTENAATKAEIERLRQDLMRIQAGRSGEPTNSEDKSTEPGDETPGSRGGETSSNSKDQALAKAAVARSDASATAPSSES